jgi:hypothetical protein
LWRARRTGIEVSTGCGGLVEVKRRYDPDDVFHLNHNLAP